MRRVRVDKVSSGEIELAKAEAHHARDVLRLAVGAEVEVFDAQGRSGVGKIIRCDRDRVIVAVNELHEPAAAGFQWTVASAVPKGNRADWMIEKLSELGTARFVPLKSARSIVLPEGKGKRQRWERIAGEAARQSRRSGVMKIDELADVAKLVAGLKNSPAWYLSTAPNARPIGQLIRQIDLGKIDLGKTPHLTLLIGPEGGWTDQEMAMLDGAGLTAVGVATTILRVETAALAAAAIVAGAVAQVAGESEGA